jgi:citrate lyase subunit beta / citryl-CoA lyase
MTGGNIQPPKAQMVLARDFVVRRSELTVPGHSMKMMARAAASNADQVMFDLEDACAVSQKVEARKTVIEALNTLDFGGKMRAFRPNNIRTRFFYRDLIEVVEAAGRNIDVIVIPKCYDAADILFVDLFLQQIEENMGFEPGHIRLEVLIESADAVLHAEQIAKSTPRLGGLIFGLVDFAGDIGAQEVGGEQFFYYNYAKAKCITAARAAGISVVDGVTLAIRDNEACRRDAQMGARMGFDGKWAIHPAQIDIIHAAYTPTAEEISRARHIVEEYEKADAQGGLGAIIIDDQMIDAAALRVEWRKLTIARKAGLA